MRIKRRPLRRGRWAFPGGLVQSGNPSMRPPTGARREDRAPQRLSRAALHVRGSGARSDRSRGFDRVLRAPAGGRIGPATRREVLARRVVRRSSAACSRLRSRSRGSGRPRSFASQDPVQQHRVRPLGPGFTLAELQHVYEVIRGRTLDRRNFRKKILDSGLLRALSKMRRGAHRPAALYSFRARRLALL